MKQGTHILFSGHTYNIQTDPLYGYQYAWMQIRETKNVLVFRVRTADNAHILLSKELGKMDNQTAYEIVLGGTNNRNLFIRRGTLEASRASTPIPGLVSDFFYSALGSSHELSNGEIRM